MTTTNAPSPRSYYPSVGNDGDKYVVWGGILAATGVATDTGAIYDISDNTWTVISSTGDPSARSRHSMVFDGTNAIVWGGWPEGLNNYVAYNNGAKLNVSTNTWSAIATTNTPTTFGHSAVWTGSEMIVWGGCYPTGFRTSGAQYKSSANTWVRTSNVNTPSQRAAHHALWTGTVMIVWGGMGYAPNYKDGSRYTPYVQ